LPVSRSDALPALITAIETNKPDTVVCLGQANDRSKLSIEKIAINLCCYRIPDNVGDQPGDEPVVADGPAAYFSTLPVDALTECLTAEGIPANVSYSAGTYVCNSLFYGLMHYIEETSPDVRGGFIHIPRGSATNLAAMTRAVKLTIEHLDV
jgi:pyroglutamyl-peptidase